MKHARHIKTGPHRLTAIDLYWYTDNGRPIKLVKPFIVSSRERERSPGDRCWLVTVDDANGYRVADGFCFGIYGTRKKAEQFLLDLANTATN
jgi:hypothetical protein